MKKVIKVHPGEEIPASLKRWKKEGEDHGEVEIHLLPGTHRLSSSLIITPDTLPRGCGKLILSGEPGQTKITGTALAETGPWEKGENRIWKTQVLRKEFPRKEDSPYEIFLDGRKYRLARYPSYREGVYPYGGVASEKELLARAKENKWTCGDRTYLHALHGGRWGDYHYVVDRIGRGKIQLSGGHQNNRFERPRSGEEQFVGGIPQELSEPGEFSFDRTTGELSLIPYEGIAPTEDSPLEMVQLKNLISLKGSEDRPLKGIEIRDLEFQGAAPAFMDVMEPLLRSDWMIHRGGALYLTGVEEINITRCVFNDLGGNGVFLGGYARGVTIRSSRFWDIGASGVAFVGSSEAVRDPLFHYSQSHEDWESSPRPGPRGNSYPENCLIADCLIQRTGRIEKQSAGVQIAMARKINVENCTVHDLPRAGINIGDGCWGGHRLSGNLVFDTVLETSDHGAFNSWGRDRFWDKSRSRTDSWVRAFPELPRADAQEPTIIENNCFRCDHGWDIDLDDGSSNYIIRGNLCLSGGIKLREGYNREVRQNIMINNGFHPHVWYGTDESDRFVNNIVMAPHAPINLDGKGAEVDRNFFHLVPVSGMPFPEWDRHSLSGDACFGNPEKGDFSLLPESPALAFGIEYRGGQDYGVISPELRKLAGEPQIDFSPQEEAPLSRGWTWRGIAMKPVEREGEMSAAGLSGKKGIIVKDGPEFALTALGLKTGDVLLKAGKTELHTQDSFLRFIRRPLPFLPRKLTLSRNQELRAVRAGAFKRGDKD